MGIVRFALRFPHTFYVLAALILFLGIIAIRVMPTDIFPEINIPVVTVIWQETGLSTPEMEQRVTTYSQYAISSNVNGIKNMEAQTLNGLSVQKIYFQPDVNLDLAIAQIVSATNAIRSLLPAGIQPPIVVQFNASSVPVLQISLTSNKLNEQQLYDYGIYRLRQQLAPVHGVTFPTPAGGKYRQIMVDLDPAKLLAKGLTPLDVVNAVNVQNLTLPSGAAKIGDTQYTIHTNATPSTIDDLNNIPIKFANGATVFVKDIGQVHDGSAVQQNIVRENGLRAVLLSVIKNGNASTLAVVNGVREVLRIAREAAPPGLKITELFDQSVFVASSVRSVIREGAIAAGLTALMILLFLGSWRSTLIVMISIPLAILASLVVLYFLGETLNTMTLGGLALAIGILVDDSTVTIENTHRLLSEQKMPLPQATLHGSAGIAVPTMVSTLAICGHDRRHGADGYRRRRRGAECRAGAGSHRRPAVRNSNHSVCRTVPLRDAAEGKRRQIGPWRIQRGNPMTEADDLAIVRPSVQQHEPAVDRKSETPTQIRPRRWVGGLLGFAALVLFVGALAFGGWRSYSQQREVAATAEEQRDFIPKVRVATVQASDPIMLVALPATTSAFASANIFARATGYIDKRNVDIGSRVKVGDLLAEIAAPELDHQIAQAEATIQQLQSSLGQSQANAELARVTNQRDSKLVKEGWVTLQQGDVDRLTLQAQQATVGVSQSSIAAEQAQLKVLNQQKAYLRVVAPFDGVITQRNVDVGDLMQADATSGTFMFTIMQSNVIRIQVHVPQDAAFGLSPGVDAVVRVPEMPDRSFPGKVTRIADALEPGTRTLLAEIDVSNPDEALTPGIYCTVELDIPRKTPSLVVPAEAIIFDRNGLRVATIENGAVRFKKVSVTRDSGRQVEISDGVKPGDQVILNPPVNLAEGSKMSARSDTAPSSTSS